MLRLVPRPRERVTSLLAVPNPAAALALLARSQAELGDTINAFELICGLSFEIVERHFGLVSPAGRSPWFVLLEASASLQGLRDATEATLAGALEAGEAVDGVMAESEAQALAIWALREHVTEAELKEGPSVKHDVSVPVSAVPDFLERAAATLARGFPGARLNAFGHAGDGNIHFNVLVQPGHDRAALNQAVHDDVAFFGGSISAEHGVGQYRVHELTRYKSVEELALMRRLKHALDPDGVMNPGKVVEMKCTARGWARHFHAPLRAGGIATQPGRRVDQLAFLTAVPTVLNVSARFDLSELRAAIRPTETMAAMRPYLMAVAPDLSRRKAISFFIVGIPWVVDDDPIITTRCCKMLTGKGERRFNFSDLKLSNFFTGATCRNTIAKLAVHSVIRC